jgi:hypothetical protein
VDRRLLGVPLGVAAAALPLAALWGYTVDDALIAGRVASNIALGLGHRFNAGGPIVDAVTPLGWAWVLAPFARGGSVAALMAAKILGAVSWLVAAGWLGARVLADTRRPRGALPLAAIAMNAPLAAWAASGMETGVVTALATFALVRSPLAPLSAGLAAAWRPELVPWACALAAGAALAGASDARARRMALALALALGPAVLVAIARVLLFGRATPLAFTAKPSDFAHGAAYALLAFAFTGPPWLAFAPFAVRRLDGHARAVLAAAALHFLSMLLAGGDWMVLWRLAVPVLPGFVLVGSALAERAAPWATVLRLALCVAVSSWALVTFGIPGRTVLANRLDFIDRARPALAGARRVAALDAGMIGAATHAPVVDLAGLTDPVIAAFPGGHTSKQLPRGLLEARGVDTVVLFLARGAKIADPWSESPFARVVEQRVALLLEPDAWRLVATLPLGGTEQSYVVLRAKR